MKKIFLLFFVAFFLNIKSSSTIAWESNMKIGCIDENLNTCTSKEFSSDTSTTSNANSDLDLVKEVKKIKENKINEKRIIKKKKEKIVKKQVNKNKKKSNKKIKKEKKKNIVKKKKFFSSLNNSFIKSNTNIDFDRDISFDEFKEMIIYYTENSDYPDISE